MDPFVTQLAHLCTTHRTRAKWVFVPAHSLGRTIGERIALEGTNWLNLRFVTPLGVRGRDADTVPLALDDGGVIIAAGGALVEIDRDGAVRARTALEIRPGSADSRVTGALVQGPSSEALFTTESGSVFAWWQRHEAGSITRSTLRSYAAGLKPVVRTLLESGAACDCPWTAKVCRKLLVGFAHLWTFAAVEGVPPHNNAAERALRHGVIWRRTSHGTDSESGSRYVERMLTVVATCRQRGRDVLGYLTDCLRARNHGAASPTLLA